ncbi:MarR family winged helix-turn-helix transcriptional regulator [Sphingopyxis flava]|uniref:DNA-binding transcriptional regulator, MarR family n=1 Tax=Sphingopyxis flava TaxID=1507287 RepID=A0A1T5CGR1_9SPHN|nr:MarR family transcriptional regulator [Sphingopyxis flava]SKB58536.1 DNA-binding transcriptional regulator, MarR family [Sphingopyxis flava]
MPKIDAPLTDADYAALADFRHALRQFVAFSEARAAEKGLTPQQHQALLAIRGAAPEAPTIGTVAQRLMLKPHSASGLIDRLELLGLVRREIARDDRRRATLYLTEKAHKVLQSLSAVHRDEIRRLRPALEDMLSHIG